MKKSQETLLVEELLQKRPHATAKEIAEEVGLSTGRVCTIRSRMGKPKAKNGRKLRNRAPRPKLQPDRIVVPEGGQREIEVYTAKGLKLGAFLFSEGGFRCTKSRGRGYTKREAFYGDVTCVPTQSPGFQKLLKLAKELGQSLEQ